MDDIRITPSNLPDATASVRKTDDVRQGVSGRQASVESTGVRSDGASHAQQALDTARIAGSSLATVGRLLPMPILQSPTLMQTEWAWRRLVMEALLQSMSQDFSQAPTAAEGPVPSTPTDSTPQAPHDTSATASGTATAPPQAESPTRSVLPPMQAPDAHPEGQMSIRGPVEPLTPSVDLPVPLRYEPFEAQDLYPTPPDPYATPGSGQTTSTGLEPETSVVSSQTGQTHGMPSTVSGQPPASAGQGVMEKALGTLWDHLAQLTESAKPSLEEGTWDLPAASLPLQAFVDLKSEDIKRLDSHQKSAVIIDRFQGATATDSSPRIGAGLFYPLPATPSSPSSNSPNRAVQWQAERQTRVTRTGQIVYRLKLTVEVSGQPVELTFLSAKPVLSVHIAAQDRRLRTRIEKPDDALVGMLQELGWQLDHWSAGDVRPVQSFDSDESSTEHS